MKIKNIIFGLPFILMIGCITAFVSCADDLDIGKDIDESIYEEIYKNNAFLRDAKTNKVSNVIELYKEQYATKVRLGLSKPATSTTKAKVKVDAEYLTIYNAMHETDFELYPLEGVTFSDEGAFIIFNDNKYADIVMNIKASEKLEDNKTYVIPLTITEQSDDITVKNDESKHCVYLVKDMQSAADVDKGENAVKGYLFFEVNDVNPLNALCFELENGKLIWDVVVLFAANINYDAAAGRPRVQCNPNVQYLLDNNERLLQPLRKRGIKVLLGLLGNHDMTGLAQLSDQGAKDFARELAQYCKAYNLDGINLDDEYSDAPDLDNPALTRPSSKAAARLTYEAKRAMPDKLITVFDYGQMYGIAEVDGVDASEWIDIVVPNYGGAAYPIGKMSKKQCAGLAAEFNLGGGSSLTDYEAKDLIREGYGWHMGFALAPTNFKRSFPRLLGVEALYGSALKPITTFYKKDDTKPYNYLTDKVEDKHSN